VTNNLNSLADGVRCPLDFGPGPERRPWLALVEPAGATPELRAVFDDACAFYAMERPPAVLRAMANDPGFARDLWAAVRATFAPGALDVSAQQIVRRDHSADGRTAL
jgi:hypothetical protein